MENVKGNYYTIIYRKGFRSDAVLPICRNCTGKKVVIKNIQLNPIISGNAQMTCEKCNGIGIIINPKDICMRCKGEKFLSDAKKLELKLNPGVPDKYEYKFIGEGNDSVN